MPELSSQGDDMRRPVVHFEIGCRDKARTSGFFTKLFDWNTQESGPATMINTGADSGINGHITALVHEPHNYVTLYVEVDDVQAYLDKAVALGGKALLPVITIPQGQFSWFSDPDGNTIGLWKTEQKPG
jgi:predicted enzyme related to lactoylglutathione lyase